MAVKIRLTRKGKKKQPTYRVVVADARAPRDGRYIEQIGTYDPRQEPSVVKIDADRAQYWLGQGAQPSDAVRKLLEISGAVQARPVPAAARPATIHVVDEAAQVAAEAEAAALAATETADEGDGADAADREPAAEAGAADAAATTDGEAEEEV